MAAITEQSTAGLLNLEKELICFICTEVLYQPLTLIDCLHTFCGSCVKEWFSHQHRKAVHSRQPITSSPYTCPTCRRAVKDAQHNAMINTLLEMFLAANPDKHRPEVEKAEMSALYKPGDEVLPKIEPRRRDRRRRDEEEIAARERRMVEEATERSRRESNEGSSRNTEHLAPSSNGQATHRSRDRQERQERRREHERRERRVPSETTETPTSARTARSRNNTDAPSPPPTSPRHPDAVEARSRAHTVAHQASIRSLVSASESGTGTGDSLDEARLMQEILAEGLLDGINVDELTEAEQDELSEIIAERYRQLHPQRLRGASTGPQVPQQTGGPDLGLGVQNLQLEQADRQPRQEIRATQRRQSASPNPRTNFVDRPATGQPRLPVVQTASSETNLSPPASNRAHRRRTSDQSGRREAKSTNRGTQHTAIIGPATRSATDLSDRPQSNDSSSQRIQLSSVHRAATEPRASPKASEAWRQEDSKDAQPDINRSVVIGGPIQTGSITPDSSLVNRNQTTNAPGPSHSISETTPAELDSSQILHEQVQVSIPSISCLRCSRTGIELEVFKHCPSCEVDLCLKCYRSGRGCNHWFGFGHAAMRKFDASHPQSRSSQAIELPHMLVGRQFTKSTMNTAQSNLVTPPTPGILREGNFCDRCGTFASTCFWACDYCNDGEWGFCNDCVNTQHCCSHPLLPIAHKLDAPENLPFKQSNVATNSGNSLMPGPMNADVRSSPIHSAPSSATSAADLMIGPYADYVQLTITTHCDICAHPISPSHARYHCPSHPSPIPQQPQRVGDYDICMSCYHNLVKIGRIKRDDGPAGWRKCPNSHRMVMTAFEPDREGGQRRVVVNDLVGGTKLSEDDIVAWKLVMSSQPAAEQEHGPQSPPLGHRGEWTWHEDSNGTRRGTRNRSSTLRSTGDKFPPDGGFGKWAIALWSYYPEEGPEGKDELMFPKHAEIKEIEEINEDWSHGVYAGDAGLFHNILVRDLKRA